MDWTIEDKSCWICGKSDNITYHHTLPQHWKPKNNIIIPICNKCHDRLNDEDLSGMRQFAFKLEQELGRQVAMWGRLRLNLERYMESQNAILEAFKEKDTQQGEDE